MGVVIWKEITYSKCCVFNAIQCNKSA